MSQRLFYFTEAWASDRERLPGPESSPQVRWWDEHAGEEESDAGADIDPVRGRTEREQLDGFVETFVIGWPRTKLIRRQGFGSEPPFKRMRNPRSAVVEMRTVRTRTFGFFSKTRVFVGMRVDLVENTHADNGRLYGVYGDYVLQRLRHIDPADVDALSDVEALIGE